VLVVAIVLAHYSKFRGMMRKARLYRLARVR
jgi:hypothetical protein